MAGFKKFKDPLYGYVRIPEDIVANIIDSAEFQRLRYIMQTSYVPLYSAALHNRFVHSLGVYHLGNKVFKAMRSAEDFGNICVGIDIDKLESIFTLACLLHDVGHAPFSHLGEEFYLKDQEKSENQEIYVLMNDAVKSPSFHEDMLWYHSKVKPAAPHEIMSVIISLKRFENYFESPQQKELFARCITGYTYRNLTGKDKEKSIHNVLISLLNSSMIDVDKLDYLIRDAYVTGYENIIIDYNRLLESAMLKENHGICYLAYKKMALSVIENVIYAHDAEKKWIQSHPVILYEGFLIQHIIRTVASKFKEKKSQDLFDFKSLLENEPAQKISLLCDDDIIHWAKKYKSNFSEEFFNRSMRRHPIWKSEAEYRVVVDGLIGEDSFLRLEAELKILKGFLLTESTSHCIDATSKDICDQKLKSLKSDNELTQEDKDNMEERYSLIQKWLKCFENIHKSQGIPFDFVLVESENFQSGFLKQDLADTVIYFSEFNKDYKLSKLISLLSSTKRNDRENFFYVYYKRKEKIIDAVAVGREIAKIII